MTDVISPSDAAGDVVPTEALAQFLHAQLEKFRAEPGTLYLVGTPIGNLGDLSPRAMAILASVDAVAAEDTRRTGLLLTQLGLRRPLVAYHAHNRSARTPALVARLRSGDALALVSDAGMPGISDPGEELVAACRAEGLPVAVVPGPSALSSAAAASGLPTADLRFLGFLPVKGTDRRSALETVRRAAPATVVLYEAPHRLVKTLQDLEAVGLGDARAAVLRELTKQHEAYHGGTLRELADAFTAADPRGEIVLLVSVPEAEASEDTDADAWWTERIDAALADGHAPARVVKDLVDAPRPDGVAPLRRNALYAKVQERRALLDAP